MPYFEAMLAAVPADNKAAYVDHASHSAPVFIKNGATRITECWGDDVPEGKINSMHTAVHRKDGEVVVMSFIEWPDKATRDAAWPKIMEDPEMAGEMPFDGSRMIFGGFEEILQK